MVQTDRVDCGIHIRRFQQGLTVGGETEGARSAAVIQRLDAQAVARQKQHALAQVPNGESEHADEVLDAMLAPFGVSLEDDFGVALGEEVVTLGQQISP